MNHKVDVHYYNTGQVGWLELRASTIGVHCINFVGDHPGSHACPISPVIEKLVMELDNYFSGNPSGFSVRLDPEKGTPFERHVWEELVRIPYGETRSYSDIARAVENPRASRAVGLANGKNMIPILIPCHRVIRSDGSLGGYGPGVHIKKKLLELEGITR